MISTVLLATDTPGATSPPLKLGTGKGDARKFKFLNEASTDGVDMPVAGTIP